MDLWRTGLRGALLLLLPALAVPAGADPRWWWHDAPAAPAQAHAHLDLDALPSPVAFEPPNVFIASVFPDPARGGILQLTASFDGG